MSLSTILGSVHKQFPEHWGPPPRVETRDLRPLPGGYGRGSSVLAGWIKRNMDADTSAEQSGRPRHFTKTANSSRVDAYMDKVLAQQKAEDVEARETEARAAADEQLLSEGHGKYMKSDAEWYRKWQYRSEYTGKRNERARSSYSTFAVVHVLSAQMFSPSDRSPELVCGRATRRCYGCRGKCSLVHDEAEVSTSSKCNNCVSTSRYNCGVNK